MFTKFDTQIVPLPLDIIGYVWTGLYATPTFYNSQTPVPIFKKFNTQIAPVTVVV